MWQKALIAVLTPTIVKVVSDTYDWVCEAIGCEDEPVKQPDRTKFSLIQIDFIHREYNHYMQTGRTTDNASLINLTGLVKYLNKHLKVNKSYSTYAKIWKNKK